MNETAEYYFKLANLLRSNGFSEDALFNYKKGISLNPDDKKGYLALGLLYDELGKSDAAFSCYRKYLSFELGHKKILDLISRIKIKNEKLKEVVHLYQNIIRKNPLSFKGYLGLASAVRLAGYYDIAKFLHQKAINLHPNSSLPGLQKYAAGKKMKFSFINHNGALLPIFYKYIRNTESIISHIQVFQWYEERLLAYIHKRYGEGGIYVDVGACFGTHALFFAKVCKADRVIAFEPIKELKPYIESTFKFNGLSIEVNSYGLGEKEYSSCIDGIQVGEKGEPVDIKIFDQLYNDINDVKLVKIDVEGMELSVLKGMRKLIQHNHPAFVIEAATEDCFKQIDGFLSSYGYSRTTGNLAVTPTYIWDHRCNKK